MIVEQRWRLRPASSSTRSPSSSTNVSSAIGREPTPGPGCRRRRTAGSSVRRHASSACSPATGRSRSPSGPTPEPGPGEVLVRVHGAGLNRADLLQRPASTRRRRASRPTSPASSSRAWSTRSVRRRRALAVGDRVFGIVGGGAQAEYARRARRRTARRCPTASTSSTTGGVPEVFITAHDAMRDPGRAAAGRVGARARGRLRRRHRGVQLAKALGCTRHRHRAHRRRSSTGAAALGLDHGSCLAPDRRARRRRARVRRSSKRPAAAPTSPSTSSAATTSTSTSRPPRARAASCSSARSPAATPSCRSSSLMGKRLAIIGTVLRARVDRARRPPRPPRSCATSCRCSPTGSVAAGRRRGPPARRAAEAYDAARVGRDVRQGHPRLPLTVGATVAQPIVMTTLAGRRPSTANGRCASSPITQLDARASKSPVVHDLAHVTGAGRRDALRAGVGRRRRLLLKS